MTETEAKKFIGWLEQRLLKKYPEEAKTELGNDLKKAPVEAARKAAEEIKASGTKFLPSPNELCALVNSWTQELNTQQRKKERAIAPEETKPTPIVKEHAAKALLLVKGGLNAMGKGLTDDEKRAYLRGMEDLGTAYPAAGWGECVSQLEKVFFKQG